MNYNIGMGADLVGGKEHSIASWNSEVVREAQILCSEATLN